MEAEQEMTRRRVLVTFDVDGTLIRSTGSASNHLHRQAFAHAFLRVFGLQNATIDAVQVRDLEDQSVQCHIMSLLVKKKRAASHRIELSILLLGVEMLSLILIRNLLYIFEDENI